MAVVVAELGLGVLSVAAGQEIVDGPVGSPAGTAA